MRCTVFALLLISTFLTIATTSGCGSDKPSVAPRTQDEIEQYKKDVYGAEAEQESEDAEED